MASGDMSTWPRLGLGAFVGMLRFPYPRATR